MELRLISHPMQCWQLHMSGRQLHTYNTYLSGAGTRARRLLLRRMRRRLGQPQALMRSWGLGVSCNAGRQLPLSRSGCKQRLRVLVQAEVGDGLAMRKYA